MLVLLFSFCIVYCRQNLVLFLCVFLSLAAPVTAVPTSAPPLLWWFTFLLDCVLGELIWLKNTLFFRVACHFKLRSVAWSSSSRGLMKSSIGIAGAVQFGVQFPFSKSDGWKKCSWHCSQLLSMLVQISQMWFLQKEMSMDTPFFALHGTFMFCISHLFQCLLQNSLVYLQDTLFGPPSLISNPNRYSKKGQTRCLSWISVFFWCLQRSLEKQNEGI